VNTVKDTIKKMVDELPETKAGQLIDYLLFLKNKEDDQLYLDSKEENEIWNLIQTDERLTDKQVKTLLKDA
jgi:hypothetical protein